MDKDLTGYILYLTKGFKETRRSLVFKSATLFAKIALLLERIFELLG
jgi:hypothetical protein